MIAGPERPPVALYVHVPFCVSRCPYCDFAVVAGRETRGPANRVAAFLDAVRTELVLRADALDARWGPPGGAGDGRRPPLRSVYLGGGTPSLLAPAEIARIVELVTRRYGLAPGAEVTLEVNPGPDERGDAAGQRSAGVTRVSIGAQSMDRRELRLLGRRHGPTDVVETARAARRAGFASVSLDLLYDVPGQSVQGWLATLDAALATSPDHLSVYALTLDDHGAEPSGASSFDDAADRVAVRPGARRWRSAARRAQDEDRAAEQYEAADLRLAAAGFAWYEISNWARPSHESRHNLAYWRREPFEAVGPGAHAFDGARRRWNGARLDAYLAALSPPGGTSPVLPPGGADLVDPRGAAAEASILGLRLAAGVSRRAAERGPLRSHLAWALESGLLHETRPGRFALTRRGRLLSNELFVRLA